MPNINIKFIVCLKKILTKILCFYNCRNDYYASRKDKKERKRKLMKLIPAIIMWSQLRLYNI
jgi:hypothetical protein